MAEAIARWIQELIATALPSGGKVGLAAVVVVAATFLLNFARERASGRMKKLFDASWQAVFALALASGGFLLLPQPRYAPFVLGLIAALVCLWASHSGAKLPDRFVDLRIGKYPLRQASVATLVLSLLLPAYALAHLAEWQIMQDRDARLQAGEGKVIVAFVLPSHRQAEDLLSASAEDSTTFEKRTFEEIYVTLRNAAAASQLKVEILPVNISIEEFEDLKQRFPPRTVDRPKLIQNLVRSSRDRSPVDIVLKSNLTVIDKDPQTARFDFQAYELDWQEQDLVLIDEFRHDLIGLASERDVRRVALLVATEFSHFLLKRYPELGSEEGFVLTAEQEQKIWDYYGDLFREHYVEHVDYHRNADPEWTGHALAKQDGPASYSHVRDWYDAFSEHPPDLQAEEQFNIRSEVAQRRTAETIESSRARGQ